jgi:hypothetical protein
MCSPEEPPGVWGVERSGGGGGNWGGAPRPDGLRKFAVGASRPITGCCREVGGVPGGRRRRPSYRLSLRDDRTRGDGKGRCFVRASRTGKGW